MKKRKLGVPSFSFIKIISYKFLKNVLGFPKNAIIIASNR